LSGNQREPLKKKKDAEYQRERKWNSKAPKNKGQRIHVRKKRRHPLVFEKGRKNRDRKYWGKGRDGMSRERGIGRGFSSELKRFEKKIALHLTRNLASLPKRDGLMDQSQGIMEEGWSYCRPLSSRLVRSWLKRGRIVWRSAPFPQPHELPPLGPERLGLKDRLGEKKRHSGEWKLLPPFES